MEINFKPRNSKDYYSIGRWLVSRRLAVVFFIFLAILIFLYIIIISPIHFFTSFEDGLRVYSYKSVALRFIDGTVKIKSEKGDIAYIGSVSSGKANGDGRLFYENGHLMYEGGFVDNQFEGKGRLYYEENNMPKYDGDFYQNEYQGTGTSFRENGSKEYSGDFIDGKPDGQTAYYDSSNNLIYQGNYSKGQLLYTDLLGKSAQDIAAAYTGKQKIYYNDEWFLVVLVDIQTVYGGTLESSPLEDSVSAENIYVTQSSCYMAGEVYNNIVDIQNKLGSPVYEGNTYLNLPESAAIENSQTALQEMKISTNIEAVSDVENVYRVTAYNSDNLVYIYTFVYEGIQYTFYCKDQSGAFYMYLLQKIS